MRVLIDLFRNLGSVDFSVLLSRFSPKKRGAVSFTVIQPLFSWCKISQNNPKTRRIISFERGLIQSLVLSFVFWDSLSASGFVTSQNNSPPPPSLEEPRNYYGYGEPSYIYWIAKRDNGGMFISNFYASPTADGVQGKVGYTPSVPHSGFKVAAGFQSLEREIAFKITYTWFNNKDNPIGNFSFPGSTGYVVDALTVTTTSGGSTEDNSQFQRIDASLFNYLRGNRYLASGPWINLIYAWEQSTATLSYIDENQVLVKVTLNQN